jgi:hypothetical protein
MRLLAAAVVAALPIHGVLVPGRSLGGVRLGDTHAQVRARLGSDHGVCESCRTATWYFTYKPFTQAGLGVEFWRGRVSAVFTLWQPPGWRASTGQRLGDPAPRGLPAKGCREYTAYVQRRGNVVTTYYVVAGKLWGFGLSRRGAPLCR